MARTRTSFLTQREDQLVVLLAAGTPRRTISRIFGTEEITIRTQIGRLYRKLNIKGENGGGRKRSALLYRELKKANS